MEHLESFYASTMSALLKGKDARFEAVVNLFPFFLPFHLSPAPAPHRWLKVTGEQGNLLKQKKSFQPSSHQYRQHCKMQSNIKRKEKTNCSLVIRGHKSGDISCYNHEG